MANNNISVWNADLNNSGPYFPSSMNISHGYRFNLINQPNPYDEGWYTYDGPNQRWVSEPIVAVGQLRSTSNPNTANSAIHAFNIPLGTYSLFTNWTTWLNLYAAHNGSNYLTITDTGGTQTHEMTGVANTSTLAAGIHTFSRTTYQPHYNSTNKAISEGDIITSLISRVGAPGNFESLSTLVYRKVKFNSNLMLYNLQSPSTNNGHGVVDGSVGTWAIDSAGAYSTTDTQLDRFFFYYYRDVDITFKLKGDYTSSSVYRGVDFCFRGHNSQNFLYAQLYNNIVSLEAWVNNAYSGASLASAAFPLASNTEYKVRIKAYGASIMIWVNDVLYINHTLIGTNLTNFNKTISHLVGPILIKGGAPTAPARIYDISGTVATS